MLKSLKKLFLGSHHFPGLLGEVEGVWQDVDVGRPLQLIPAVGGDVELDVIALQQGHLGLGVLLPKRKLLVGKTDPGSDAARQRVVLWHREPRRQMAGPQVPGVMFDSVEELTYLIL